MSSFPARCVCGGNTGNNGEGKDQQFILLMLKVVENVVQKFLTGCRLFFFYQSVKVVMMWTW